MPYRICKTLEIENGHMLSKHPDACRFPHGHTRKVELVLEADELDACGMVCDFKIIKQAVGEAIDRYDHAMCMNTDDPMFPVLKASYGERVIGFDHVDPTTEVLAKTFFDQCSDLLDAYRKHSDSKFKLASGVRLIRVRVWETSSSWAEYQAD